MDESLAVDDPSGVEFGDAGDGSRGLGGVEVDDFLGGLFEGEDDWVGWEDSEVGMEFLVEYQRWRRLVNQSET